MSKFAMETRNKIEDWEFDMGEGSVGGTKYVDVLILECTN